MRLLYFLLIFLFNFNAYTQDLPQVDLLLKHNKKWKMSRVKNGSTVKLLLNEQYDNKKIKGILTDAQDSIIYVDSIGFEIKNIKKIFAKGENSKELGKEEIIIGSGQLVSFVGLSFLLNASANSFVQLSSFSLMVPLLIGGIYYLIRGINNTFFLQPYNLNKYRVEYDDPKAFNKRKKKSKQVKYTE